MSVVGSGFTVALIDFDRSPPVARSDGEAQSQIDALSFQAAGQAVQDLLTFVGAGGPAVVEPVAIEGYGCTGCTGGVAGGEGEREEQAKGEARCVNHRISIRAWRRVIGTI